MMPFEINASRIAYDLRNRANERYKDFWGKVPFKVFNPQIFAEPHEIWLEIGAGSGWFFVALAKHRPDRFLIAVERSKMRAKRLVKRAQKSGLPNLAAFRGNAIPAVMHEIPHNRLERIYILYPCPWPRMSQRKNRWYLHPIMAHLVRILKPGGQMIWASDQRFYIEEARFVSEKHFGLRTLCCGELAPNAYNSLEHFPEGRTKFENAFLGQGLPCFEWVGEKPSQIPSDALA